MTTEKAYRFSSFRLDPHNWRLHKNNEFRPLRPKTFAVLRYLLDNAGRLVTKEDLFGAIWPDTNVAESALPVCMNELRKALDDDSHRPRFVETVHRLGYRFIAPVALAQDEDEQQVRLAPAQPVVGRETELARLLECWERALGGARQVVFVIGEPGIGKTTIADKLLDAPQVSGFALIGRGQCADRYGKESAYLPVLEAIGQICSGAYRQQAGELIRRDAPSWAAHLPQLQNGAAAAPTDPNRRATPAQMLSEMAAALVPLTAMRPIMLVLEDLHLSDRATIDLIAYLARRRDRARLMIVGTYRSNLPGRDPAQLAATVRELTTHRQCQTLALKGLKEADVADFLHQRIDGAVPPHLVSQLHRRTSGNPLFMTAVVDHLDSLGSARSWPADLRESGVPDNVHAMIEQQIEDLEEDDLKILKFASVAGATGLEFSSAALVSALEIEASAEHQDEIEEKCEHLARRISFLRATGVSKWPDGTIAAGYAFTHALYQEVLYGMMTSGQRARAHLRIANRLEAAYGSQAPSVAAELALHFERGGDYSRAAACLHTAADSATSRGAPREALALIEKALKLLKALPRNEDRVREEFRLVSARMATLANSGVDTPGMEANMRQLNELARELDTWAAVLLVVQGITRLVVAPLESRAIEIMIKTGLRQAESRSSGTLPDEFAPLQSIAHAGLCTALNIQGKFRRARFHAERAIATHTAGSYQFAGADTKVFATVEGALANWFMGFPERAEQGALEAIGLAERVADAPALAFALARASTIFGLAREWKQALALAERQVAFCAGKDIHPWSTWGAFLCGASRVRIGEAVEGCRIMRSALAELDSRDGRPSFTTHARAELRFAEMTAGLLRPHEASAFVQESIDECVDAGTTSLLADLYRMMGLTRLAGAAPDRAAYAEAEKFLRKGLETARSQGAKSFEMRVALDLARLWQSRGKAAQARKLLSSIYRRFSEGRSTPDLIDAKLLIAELGRASAARS